MSNVAPVVNEATSDQASYAPGAAGQITVKYTPGMSENTVTFTGTTTDTTTGLSGSMSGTYTVGQTDPSTTTVTDDQNPPGTYTLVSDDGAGTAVFSFQA